jgi:hypothetical protein
MAGKKPDDFSIEPVEQTDAPPLDFETAFGGLQLPPSELETLRALVVQLQEERDTGAITDVDKMVIGGFRFTSTGLVQVDENITEDGLQLVGNVLHRFKISYQWLVADFLRHAGIYAWADMERMAAYFRVDVQTLKNWKSVGTNVPQYLRGYRLDFGHFKEVAPLSEDKQKEWLERAEYGDPLRGEPDKRKRWSVARLAREIAGSKKKSGKTSTLLDRTEKRMDTMMARWRKPTVTRDQRQAIAKALRKYADDLERD